VVDPTQRQSPRRACTVAEIAVDDKYAVVGGPFGSKLVTKDYTETGIPVLRGSNLPFDRKIDLSDVVFVSEAKVKEDLFGNLAFPGDIVVTQRGTLGQVGLLPLEGPYDRYVISQSQMKLSIDRSKADPRFIYWYFRLPAVRKTFENLDSSSGVPHINLETFRSFELFLPNLGEQGLIATVLDSFDDLIENNRRRIELLEETARLLYREWFVHFRYPGHEDVPPVDSELGPIPEGWEIREVGSVCKLVRGRSYRGEELVEEGGIAFLNLKCVERGGGFRSDGIKRYSGPFKPAQQTYPGDTVIAMTDMTQERHVVGHAARVPSLDTEFGVISLDLNRVIANPEIDSDYLYGMFRYSEFSREVKEFANGTNVLHLNPRSIEGRRFPCAPEHLQQSYADSIRAGVELIDQLEQQNKLLAETRDLLLPRLVSGELDVSDFDLDLEAVG